MRHSWNRAACGRRIGMCGYTSVPEDGRTCLSVCYDQVAHSRPPRYVLIVVVWYLHVWVGETQQSYYPGLSRGLVTILLYYDGKACIVHALRLLLQASAGRTWALPGLSTDVIATVTGFTESLINDGLIGKLLGQFMWRRFVIIIIIIIIIIVVGFLVVNVYGVIINMKSKKCQKAKVPQKRYVFFESPSSTVRYWLAAFVPPRVSWKHWRSYCCRLH